MCDHCQWEDLLEEIEGICNAGGYEFADRTLTGIYDRVKENQHCTEKQKIAIENIKRSKRPRRRW